MATERSESPPHSSAKRRLEVARGRGMLALKSLRFHWRMHVAVGLGVAVACAILTGSLVVGDSVRETLRAIARERLGRFQVALVVNRFFDASLAARIASSEDYPSGLAPPVAALILEAGAVADFDGARGRRAGGVSVVGVDDDFGPVGFPPAGSVTLPKLQAGRVVLNQNLASEIGVKAEDTVLLNFQKDTEAPLESFLGQRTDAARTLRLTVQEVIPDRGPGLFSLALSQTVRPTAYLPRSELAKALGTPEAANVLMVALPSDRSEESGDEELTNRALRESLRATLTIDDLGLRLTPRPTLGYLILESERMVIEPAVMEATVATAERLEMPISPVLTHLAATISVEKDGETREIAYSTVAALDTGGPQPFGPLTLIGGKPAPKLKAGEILINEWAAEDLRIEAADVERVEVELEYYVTEVDENVTTDRASFRLRGIVSLEGVAADPSLTPEFPGITSEDIQNMRDWNPPFEIDRRRIGDRDEEYWQKYRATPKAFVAPEVGRECFQSRFGAATQIRLAPSTEESLERAAERFSQDLIQRSVLAEKLGFGWRPVRREALEASSGSTDFGMLFASFSFFLIISAAILIALLFGLQIDRRGRDTGLSMAVGFSIRTVKYLYLLEATLVAGLGGLVGVGIAFAYGAALLGGLQTWWWEAVQVPFFVFAAHPLSLTIGYVLTEGVVLTAILLAARRLGKTPVRNLLAGALASHSPLSGRLPHKSLWVAGGSVVVAVALLPVAMRADRVLMVGAFFGVGGATLVAALSFLSAWLRMPTGRKSQAVARPTLIRVGIRNSRRAPTRSLLTAALVSSATFILVAVAANHHDPRADQVEKASGNGGFALVATTEAPLTKPLDTESGRQDLGIEDLDVLNDRRASHVDWQGLRSFPFRVRPGDDASCLNLYAPQSPRLLGAPDELIERGGFLFKEHLGETAAEKANPWLLLRRTFDDGAIPAIGDWNSTTWILKKGLGSDLTLNDDRGEKTTLRIVATLTKSIFQGELVVGADVFQQHFPDREGFRYFLLELPKSTESPERVTEIQSALEQGLEAYGMDTKPTSSLIASYLAVENTYLSTFQLLGGLGLILGTLGLGVVLVRSVIERRGELALLRAVGFSRRRLSVMVLAEELLLLSAGVGAGAIAAILAVLPRLTEPAAVIPWFSLGMLLCVVVVAGLLSSVAAVWVTSRTPILPVLRQE